MKRVLPQGFYLQSADNQPQETKELPLVLFFDINDTMFIGDSAKGVTKEQAIQKLFAEQDQFAALWDVEKTQEKMTYRKFVDKYLIPDAANPEDKKEKDRIKAAREVQYGQFVSYLQKVNHPLLSTIQPKYEAMVASFGDSQIVPAFIKLIRYLDETMPGNYTIVFRTFGKDIDKVLEELEAVGIHVSSRAAFQQGKLVLKDGRVLSEPEDMLAQLIPGQHMAIQDDYSYWNKNGEQYEFAKPFPINLKNPKQTCVFADDNVKKRIVCVKPVGETVPNQKTLQAALEKRGNLLSVDTYTACDEEGNYFIQNVRFAVEESRKDRAAKAAQFETFDDVQTPDDMHGILPAVLKHGTFKQQKVDQTKTSANNLSCKV